MPDNLAGVSCCNAVGRNAFRDHTAGSDDAACADGHALQDYAMRANPCIIPDYDWCRLDVVLQILLAEMCGSIPAPHHVIHLMGVSVNDEDTCADVYVVADIQPFVYSDAGGIHPDVIADIYYPPQSCQKGSLQIAAYRVDAIAARHHEVVADGNPALVYDIHLSQDTHVSSECDVFASEQQPVDRW